MSYIPLFGTDIGANLDSLKKPRHPNLARTHSRPAASGSVPGSNTHGPRSVRASFPMILRPNVSKSLGECFCYRPFRRVVSPCHHGSQILTSAQVSQGDSGSESNGAGTKIWNRFLTSASSRKTRKKYPLLSVFPSYNLTISTRFVDKKCCSRPVVIGKLRIAVTDSPHSKDCILLRFLLIQTHRTKRGG